MNKIEEAGIGLDMELEQEETQKESNTVTLEEAKKKRRPFHIWTVGGVDHKMKLTTGMIEKLESKYGTNVMNLLITNEMPTLSVMLTVIQAAVAPWEHGCSIEKARGIYEGWVEEGGSQSALLNKVIFPTLAVSGFFTGAQVDSLMNQMEEADFLN